MFGKRVLLFFVIVAISTMLVSVAAHASPGYSHVALAHRPAVFWRLGELTGTVAYDASANRNDGVYQGNPTLGSPGSITRDPSTSANFAGPYQDVAWVPNSTMTGSFTVTAWIDNTGSTGHSEQTFFDTRTPFAEYSFDFKLSNGDLKVDVGTGATWLLTGPGIPFSFQTGTWYQVTAVVTSAEVTLYVNGHSIGSESYPYGTGVPLLYDTSHVVYLATNARYGSGEEFLGRIDDVAIYATPLSADQIAGLYHSGVAW
jgi:hypothetical protein